MAKTKPKTSTLILLVRHGRTPTTGKVLPGRAKGLHLSEEGAAQAQSVALRMAESFNIDAIYTSPIERARETAAPLVKATGVKATVDKRLSETETGEWTGIDLVKANKLPEWKWVMKSPGTFQFPGGESFLDMQARMSHALRDIAAAHTGQTVAVVSHADPIKVAVVTALQAPLTAIHHIEVATCSVTALEIDGEHQSVLAVGNTDDFRGIAK